MREPQIILLAMPGRYWLARRAALGVVRYAQQHCRWELLIAPFDQPDAIRSPAQVGADGAIISGAIPRPAGFADCPQPVVVIDTPLLEGIRPRVITDRRAVGRLAVEYLIGRGYRHFGYVSGGLPEAAECLRGFEEVLREQRGAAVAVHDHPLRLTEVPLRQTLEGLSHWLLKLPRPAAVLGCDDQHAAITIQAARHAGLRVPEDVAVLGVQDEAIFRDAAHVSLSTIALACERMGYEAASMLHAMMQGHPPPCNAVRIPPVEVITRHSTDCRVVSDPEVARAVAWIAEHLHEPFGIRQLLAHLAVSRSTLERRFKAMLGRSPLDEVLRQRVERARSLLVDTDLGLKQIAESCGFRNRIYFGSVFRKLTGESPARYRARYLRRNQTRAP